MIQKKKAQHRTSSQLHIRGKMMELEHPKFEGHMTPNADEYEKSFLLKLTYCLSWSIIIHR